ncbi:MAG: hypothetical protein F6K62_10260, partial [Sphaerospermopsis sp. SIO1G2]|nr:hypothetical protein [Sphaerospermopsis sp. SIO1G2]
TLLADALRATRHVAGFHESLIITLIETSDTLRRFQRASLLDNESLIITLIETSDTLRRFQRASLLDMHPRISWQSTLDELPDMPILWVANEFFDALPIRQYVRLGGGLQERLVTVNQETDALEFIVRPMEMQLVKGGDNAATSKDATAIHDRHIVESSPLARHIATQLAHHMAHYGGAGLMIDYGYTGESRGNTLQAVHKHGFWPVLSSPGEADITAHIAFDDLCRCFTDQHITASDIIGQGAFLQAIGGTLRLEHIVREAHPDQREDLIAGYERLISPQQMGELFKVLGLCSDASLTMPGFTSEDTYDT